MRRRLLVSDFGMKLSIWLLAGRGSDSSTSSVLDEDILNLGNDFCRWQRNMFCFFRRKKKEKAVRS